MGLEAEEEEQQHSNLARLPVIGTMHSPERPGTVTPPLHTSVAIPFRWEQVPGKPIPCNALIPLSNPNKCLELPPRLLLPTPSTTTTVFQTPYKFRSPSFRTSNGNCYGSLGTEKGFLGAMILSKGGGLKDSGWFGSLRKRGFKFKVKREVAAAVSHVFPSSSDNGETLNVTKMKRSGSSSSVFRVKPRVWTNICEGLKQVVPWRRKKLKKEKSGIGL